MFTGAASHANKEFADVNLTVFMSGDESLTNFSLNTKVDIKKLIGTFSFNLPKNEKDADFQNRVMQSTVNMCKLGAGVRGNFLTKMLMEDFYKAANFTLECPMPARNYNLSNLKITDTHIPTYLLVGDLNFMIQLRVQAKIPIVKQMVYLYHLKFFGTAGRD